MFFQILKALHYLASQNLCHRDVKPANILYSKLDRAKYLFELADFGLVIHQRLASNPCGTSGFMAPEVDLPLLGYPQTPKMDIYSLAMTIEWAYPDMPGSIYRSPSWVWWKPAFNAMTIANPAERASAEVLLFGISWGESLTKK